MLSKPIKIAIYVAVAFIALSVAPGYTAVVVLTVAAMSGARFAKRLKPALREALKAPKDAS